MERKWYRSGVAKTLLIIIAHVMIVLAAGCAYWAVSYPQLVSELFSRTPNDKYENSDEFNSWIFNNSIQVMQGIKARELFETEGKEDLGKIVDLEYFDQHTSISGDLGNGLAYKLGDLLEWYENGIQNRDSEMQNSDDPMEDLRPIVCKRSDGTFHYYNMKEFDQMIRTGQLQFVMTNDENGISSNKIMEKMEQGKVSSMETFMGIQDEEGKMIYVDCWRYDGYMLVENCQLLGAPDILALVNENVYWNGRLNEAYRMIEDAVYRLGSFYDDYESLQTGFVEGDTNYFYLYADVEHGTVITNQAEYASYEELAVNLEQIKEKGRYVIVRPKLAGCEGNLDELDASMWRDEVKYTVGEKGDFIFATGVDTAYPIHDQFYRDARVFEKYSASMRVAAVVMVVSVIGFLVCVVWLMVVAGRNNEDEEIHLCAFDHWKTELSAALIIGGWAVPVFFGGYGFAGIGSFYNRLFSGGFVCAIGIYTCAMFLIGILSLTRRIKARTIWKDSILRMVLKFVRMVFQNLNYVFKTIVLYGIFVLTHWAALLSAGWINEVCALIMLAAEAAAFVVLIYNAIGKDKIRKGIEKIAGGEVDYKIPMTGLRGEHRAIAEAINSIGSGLDAAVEKSMKSERLKTDLITNVSHDIKTPLTSIINYVDLLKKENFEDPKVQRYLEILEAKSQRLKTLTEDVVEASKVSSGNITLEYMNINLVELIQQTSGEFEEKFSARNLKEVLTLPEEGAIIRADGRRVWRVLENVYNNAAKYAMEGTRVYADLKVEDNRVIFSLKNISEQSLNISADELTERFIRGDISRSTEGSGLGLSIAKTLTQMQGGKFELYLDGDLFKVTIEFPRIEN